VNDETYWTHRAMQQYGGSFIKALAGLIVVADDDNLVRIRLAWPEYWKDYSEMGQRLKELDAKANTLKPTDRA
jgi:hypothetical protein